jgi:serine phosphatase RsbU (regulator of sigma subunit)
VVAVPSGVNGRPALPTRPLGLQESRPGCCETRLEPGDRLLLYLDGIVEAAPRPGSSSAKTG